MKELPKELYDAAHLIVNYFSGGRVEDGDPSLVDTPARMLKALYEMCTEDPKDEESTLFDANGYDQLILVKDIPFYSLCEHHMLPFFGVVHVAYLPDPEGKILGLSKIPRIVRWCSRDMMTQEALTQYVARWIEEKVNPRGVGVVVKARHMCMEARGVSMPNTYTTTSIMNGLFRSDHPAREELLELMKDFR